MSAALVAALQARYRLVGPLQAPFPAAFLALEADATNDIGGLVCLGTENVGAAEIACMPALRIIAALGSGYDGIDALAAQRRGVALTHGRGANASSVADLALGLMIECVRQIPRMRSHLYAGRWNGSGGARPAALPGLTGRRLGIYGLGAIGSQIARRALAMDMSVGYHGRHQRADCSFPYFSSLLELAQWCDVLMVAARADAGNRHAVNRQVIHAIGAEGYLVNVARGSLVDESALIEALQGKVIAGAGLDVFEHEPEVPAPLLALPNVALTPHIGGVTSEARAKLEDMLLVNLETHLPTGV